MFPTLKNLHELFFLMLIAEKSYRAFRLKSRMVDDWVLAQIQVDFVSSLSNLKSIIKSEFDINITNELEKESRQEDYSHIFSNEQKAALTVMAELEKSIQFLASDIATQQQSSLRVVRFAEKLTSMCRDHIENLHKLSRDLPSDSARPVPFRQFHNSEETFERGARP